MQSLRLGDNASGAAEYVTIHADIVRIKPENALYKVGNYRISISRKNDRIVEIFRSIDVKFFAGMPLIRLQEEGGRRGRQLSLREVRPHHAGLQVALLAAGRKIEILIKTEIMALFERKQNGRFLLKIG